MTASKQKGTKGEGELVKVFRDAGFEVRRTSPGVNHDIEATTKGAPKWSEAIQALATRPDRGQWLVSIKLTDFVELLAIAQGDCDMEVKRHKRFAHHTIYEQKFGR
jgi:Holliday junction resolvase